MTPDTSGRTLRVPLAHYDPDSSSWRTSQGMFPSGWPTSSETCPRWGMTRRGELFELPTPALPTVEHASSSAPLIGTPTVNPAPRSERFAVGRTPNPAELVALLPTPVADHSRGLPQPGTDFQSLPNAVISLLPTPAVNDMGASYTPETWDAWTAKMQAAHGNGNGHGKSLSIEALRLLPTPDTGESLTGHGRRGGKPGNGSQSGASLESVAKLLPTPVASDAAGSGSRNLPGSKAHPGESLTDVLIHGGSTRPRSADGNTPSDDPHPTPPSPDATDPDSLPLSWNG